jgi:hypothetical protein
VAIALGFSVVHEPCGSGGAGGTQADVTMASADGSMGEAADAACSGVGLSMQRFDSSGACFGPLISVPGACYVRSEPAGRSVSVVCGLSADGQAYAGVIGTNDRVFVAGWTFALEGALDESLADQALSASNKATCQQVIAAFHETPRPSCM